MEQIKKILLLIEALPDDEASIEVRKRYIKNAVLDLQSMINEDNEVINDVNSNLRKRLQDALIHEKELESELKGAYKAIEQMFKGIEIIANYKNDEKTS